MKQKKNHTLLLLVKTAINAVCAVAYDGLIMAMGAYLTIYPFAVIDNILPLDILLIIVYIVIFVIFFKMIFYLEDRNGKPWMPFNTGKNLIVPQDEDED